MSSLNYTPSLLRRLQLTELEMLKEVDRICREQGINYIIDAGTLLGAVRHGGFIPWDDDIDIRMLRRDYDRFCEICKTQLDKKYFLQTYQTDPGYRWGYARILKNGTTFIRQDHEEIKSRNGIFIDIFPNDNLPEDFLGYTFCTYASLFCRKMLYSQVGKNHGKSMWKRAGFWLLDLFPKRWAYRMYEYMTNRYKELETKKVRCWGWGSPEETAGFCKEWMEDTCDIKFEDIIVRAPVKTHEFLVHSFGEDYMTPPPEAERQPRHTAKYIKF